MAVRVRGRETYQSVTGEEWWLGVPVSNGGGRGTGSTVSLKQRPKLDCFQCAKNDPKNILLRSFAIIAGLTRNNSKRTLLLAAFDVSSCFVRKMIELTKNVSGLNQPLE